MVNAFLALAAEKFGKNFANEISLKNPFVTLRKYLKNSFRRRNLTLKTSEWFNWNGFNFYVHASELKCVVLAPTPSKHANFRAKERMGMWINKEMASEVVKFGIVLSVSERKKFGIHGGNAILFKENIFILRDNIITTVFKYEEAG